MKQRAFITPIGNESLYVLDTASWRDFRPVMNKEKCVECGICLTFCPLCAVRREGKKYIITYDYCKGCGLCAHECPKKAIDMLPEHEAAGKGGK